MSELGGILLPKKANSLFLTYNDRPRPSYTVMSGLARSSSLVDEIALVIVTVSNEKRCTESSFLVAN